MRVLITGASGFLGSHLCRRMVQDGHQVRILCRATSNTRTFDDLPVERVEGDLTQPATLAAAVADRQWVVHAAANISYWKRDAVGQRVTNVDGTRYVADACRTHGVQRFVHVSSVAAIGIPADSQHPATEEFAFNLERSGLAYHLSKWQAEREVAAAVSGGLPAIIVNPGSIFGPHGTGYRGGEMFQKVERGVLVPYFTGGISAVHVADVVDGIIAAFERGMTGERYILGGENITYHALAERVAARLRLSRRFVPLPPVVTGLAALLLGPLARLRRQRPTVTFTTHYLASRFQFYDSTKARDKLGYRPREFDAILDDYLCATRHPLWQHGCGSSAGSGQA